MYIFIYILTGFWIVGGPSLSLEVILLYHTIYRGIIPVRFNFFIFSAVFATLLDGRGNRFHRRRRLHDSRSRDQEDRGGKALFRMSQIKIMIVSRCGRNQTDRIPSTRRRDHQQRRAAQRVSLSINYYKLQL